jgi:acyl-CoA thioesterase II
MNAMADSEPFSSTPSALPITSFDAMFDLQPTDTANRWTCEYSRYVLTPRGTLQGGAGLAAALLAMEKASGRSTVWATAQYLSYAAGLDPIDLDVTLEVEGFSTTQARCTVFRNGEEILTTHAALGDRLGLADETWIAPPDGIPGPEESRQYDFFANGRGDLADLIEMRVASGRTIREFNGERGAATTAFWCRLMPQRHAVSVGELAFIGDLLPVSFCELYGALYSGTSIDNTLRLGPTAETEWMLLDCHLEQIANGFGHGRVHMWSDEGVLLGTASQTMAVRFSERKPRRVEAAVESAEP